MKARGRCSNRSPTTPAVARLEAAHAVSRLEPVLDAVRRVRAALGPQTALIGFAGAPWTVATYMVEGGSSRDFRRVKAWAYGDPAGFAALIDMLDETTIELLAAQIAAGAEVVQLFDSWAGVLPEAAFARWVIAPTKRIVAALKQRHPGCPVIGFPRGAGVLYERYAAETGVDAVGLDTTVPAWFACARLRPLAAVQGNLDPVAAADRRRRPGKRGRARCAGHLPAGPGSSISAMACCRRRRPSMSLPSLVCWPNRSPPGDMPRTAIVLMNLGGPDSLAAVEPFLFNLFKRSGDHPAAGRRCVCRWHGSIARGRASTAREIYARLGGASPLLANTEAQARALETALGARYRCFVAMRYWHPTSAEAARAVAEWGPDEIVCLPLYPQFSTTTTASSLAPGGARRRSQRLDQPTRASAAIPARAALSTRIAGLIRPALAAAGDAGRPPRLLLTAHGLPKRDRAGRRPLSQPGRADRAGCRRRARQARASTGGCAIRAGSARSNGSARRPTPRSGAPAPMASRWWWRRSRSCRSIRRPWSNSISTIAISPRRAACRAIAGLPTVGVAPGFIAALAALVRGAGSAPRWPACADLAGRCARAGALA